MSKGDTRQGRPALGDAPGPPTPAEAAAAHAGLRGEPLTAQLWLNRDAVINYARLTDGPDDHRHARFALLDAAREHGTLTVEHPDWMTSAKPGIDAWLTLPDRVCVSLRYAPADGRTWLSVNAHAPRRGRKRPASTDRQITPANRRFTSDQVAWAAALSRAQLADAVHVSDHCAQRLRQRARTDGDIATITRRLKAAVRGTGQFVATAPGWADGGGHRQPVVLCDFDGDTVALALRPADPPGPGGEPMVAATCVAHSWALEDLPVEGEALADKVTVSTRHARRHLQRAGRPDTDQDARAFVQHLADRLAVHGRAAFEPSPDTRARFPGVRGPHALVGDMCLVLRRVGDADGWVAGPIHTAGAA